MVAPLRVWLIAWMRRLTIAFCFLAPPSGLLKTGPSFGGQPLSHGTQFLGSAPLRVAHGSTVADARATGLLPETSTAWGANATSTTRKIPAAVAIGDRRTAAPHIPSSPTSGTAPVRPRVPVRRRVGT